MNAEDRAELWTDYARRLRAAAEVNESQRDSLRDRAFTPPPITCCC